MKIKFSYIAVSFILLAPSIFATSGMNNGNKTVQSGDVSISVPSPKIPVRNALPPEENKNMNSSGKDDKKYDAVIRLLKTKTNVQGGEAVDDPEISEFKIKQAKKEEKYKNEEFEKTLLPIPKKSIIINDSIIVYAEYREKILAENVKPYKGSTQETQNNSGWKNDPLIMEALAESQNQEYKSLSVEDSFEYDKKLIKLRVGDVFGNYVVKSLSSSVVVYQNKKTKKYIKKFY